MVQQNKNSNKLTKLKLSIQISLSGLSFCTLNPDKNTITFIKEIHFDKILNPLEVLDSLKEQFHTESILDESFSDVCIIHDNDLSTLVPKPLFKEENLADYLKFSSKILKSDFITFDEILINDSVNVYVPYMNINNFIYEKFGEFTYKHISSILINEILLSEKNAENIKMYVHLSKIHFELIVVENAKLRLYNTFKYNTKEDFIYFVLFTAEQLNLNPETLDLIFIGDITKDDDLYNMAYKYIRHISFGKRNDTFKYSSPLKTDYSNFALIKSL